MEQVSYFRRKVTGAKGSDLVDGGTLALQAYGKKCRRDDSSLVAMAYLWRRFGPPWFGTDSHKRIAGYYLTTADPEVWLNIDISASGLDMSVGYMVTRRLDMQWRHSILKDVIAWDKKFEGWFWEKHKHLPHKTEAEIQTIRTIYEKWRYGDMASRKENPRIVEAEKAIGKYPLINRGDTSRWRKGPPIQRRVNRALFDALKELERPVFVRDIPINIFGRCEVPDGVEATKPSVYAGMGVSKKAMDKVRKRR